MLVTRSLTESAGGSVGEVDRANRVLRRVKILGATSPNTHGMEGIRGTKYSAAAMDKAIPLYEGRKSYADHPSRTNPGVERATRDLVGVHRNVRREADGLYSDFHYRSAHAYLADDAEQMPDALGFSHNATGSGRITNGEYLVESIDKVRSIDLVTQPATTCGLYESEETPMATKTLAEALKPLKLGAKVSKQLLEMDGMDGDAALVAPVAGEDAASYKDHLGEAIKAVLADDSLDLAAKKAKIMAILKATDDKPADEPPAVASDAPTMESLQTELQQLRSREAIRELCESEGFKPSKIQLKSLTLLESDDERLEFITEQKALTTATAPPPAPKSGPRSQSSRNLAESRETKPTATADEFAAALLN